VIEVCGHTSKRVNTTTVDAMSSSSVVSVIAMLAAWSGSHAKGEKTTAASGGYVNGRSRPARVWNIAPSAYSGLPSSQACPPIR
jgi:hypothetical protein